MSSEKAHNGRFLGALGFLGFLGFLAFTGTRHHELARFAWLSLPSLLSLGVLIPFDKATVKVPVNPGKKGCLGFLGFLGCLCFLGSGHPDTACLAVLAVLAGMSTQPEDTRSKPTQSKQELAGGTL